MSPNPELTIADIFSDTRVGWGKKYPPETSLLTIWERDKDYLIWACNLRPGKPCDNPPGPVVRGLVDIAFALSQGKKDDAAKKFSEYQHWFDLSQRGEGLEKLPRPSRDECLKIFEQCTLLGGHGDLDGLFSMATAIFHGKALLGGGRKSIPYGKLRIFRYSFRNLEEYTAALEKTDGDITAIIDYAAHPLANLTLDHHATSLHFWNRGSALPVGIFDTAMPSCPRLLATYCGFPLSEELLRNCDMIDGAQYKNVAQTTDLTNPFVALELALTVDVSDAIAKKVIITLAENALDPNAVLQEPVWKARVAFIKEQLSEQRSYWSKPQHYSLEDPFTAIADGSHAPYSPSRFRYMPFENPDVISKPFLLSIRGGIGQKVNIGIARNPFFSSKDFYSANDINLGALAKQFGQGGGRREVGACTIVREQLATIVSKIQTYIRDTVKS